MYICISNKAKQKPNIMTTLRTKVLSELVKMGNTVLESEKLINQHFENATYLKSARQIALYMTA